MPPESDILNAEEGVGPARGARVFAGSEEKIEREGSAGGGGQGGRVSGRLRQVEGRLDQLNGNWADAGWGGIGSGPSPEQGLEAKIDGAVGVEARVRGPHAGERLAHRS